MLKKINWNDGFSLEYLVKKSKNTMVEYLGIEFTEIDDHYLVAKMPVDHRTKQPYGIMHGGASCVLAESVGSTAANACVDPDKYHCVGLSINTNHIRIAKKGFVFGKAEATHLGQTTQIWNIDIRDERERLISATKLTMAVLKKPQIMTPAPE
ncbi:MAG: hotdog fold thioesterase [Gammaproteobacteria bacterium]|nr:hotdog fold thioesterase [Gammaproteobacteria bacterium]